MALAKTSLPKMNQSNQRTHPRPRDLAGNAARNLAWRVNRTAPWGSNGTLTANSAFTVTNVTNNRVRLQKFLSAGLIKIAP